MYKFDRVINEVVAMYGGIHGKPNRSDVRGTNIPGGFAIPKALSAPTILKKKKKRRIVRKNNK